jgi:hypothetical protein
LEEVVMKRSRVAGIALTMLIGTGAFAVSAPGSKAVEESAAKQALMDSINQCEMLDRTDARESCMDRAWAQFKKARAAEKKSE